MKLETVDRRPNGRRDRNRGARAFNLVREDGTWKLAENLYLDRGYAAVKEVQQAVREGLRKNPIRTPAPSAP